MENNHKQVCCDIDKLLQRDSNLTYKEIQLLIGIRGKILEKAVLSQGFEDTLVYLCQLAEKLLPDSVSSIMILDKTRTVLNVLYAPSVPSEAISLLNGIRPGPEAGSCGNTAYQRKAQFVCDTSTDPRWGDLREFALRFNIQACWSVPIYGYEEKEIIGTFALSSSQKRLPTPFHQTLLEVCADLASLILQRQKLDQRLTHLALHDSLTDLPNRTYLTNYIKEQIAKAQQEKSQLAIIYIDLDRFKYINDTYGHLFGDKVLIEIAYRFQQINSEQLLISRVGGDEFIVVMNSIISQQSIINMIEFIMQSIQEPFEIDGKNLSVMSSVGISIYPQHGKDENILLSNADVAMYEAKRKGSNQYFFYSPYLQDKLWRSLSIEQELKRAIEHQEFELYYQPKVNAKTVSISGIEALIRWKHPQKGWIRPNDFIGIAEETGLIIPLGEWIIEESCQQLKQWQELGLKQVPMSINISNRQLTNKTVERLLTIIERTEIASSLLEFEMTETYVIQNIDEVTILLKKIQNFGIKIALDDFGTGYSSLGLLKDLPLNRLKIDKSLINQITKNSVEQAICKSVITISKVLGLKVTAEGIETPEQAAFMQSLDCDELQGYYFGRPVEVSLLEERYLRLPE